MFEELDFSTAKYKKKKNFQYVCRDNSHHLLNILFLFLPVLYVNFAVK